MKRLNASAPNNLKMCSCVFLVSPDHICLAVGLYFAEMRINGCVHIIRTVHLYRFHLFISQTSQILAPQLPRIHSIAFLGINYVSQ